jgi:ABC-type dipeptide/oligopeptide/nickel transport system permease component
VIVENIFGLPGMGQELVTAINARDYAVVEAAILIGAAMFILINMLSDWLYVVVDPRLRVEGAPA